MATGGGHLPDRLQARAAAGVAVLLLVLAMGAGLVPGAGPGPAARAKEDPLVYVALGDSFTSGPLVLPHDTAHVPQDCGQSSRNYPHLVALMLGVNVLRDVSCGSAKIDHLFEAQDGLPLGGTNARQADALGPGVDIVTIGMGGNDAGFTGVVEDCFRFLGEPPLGDPPCHPDFVEDGVNRVVARIEAMQTELTEALVEVQRLAPNAVVLVVGYPTSLPDDGVACWPYLPILPEDMPHLVEWFKLMNTALEAAAVATGTTYVDIYTPSIGHDACKLPGIAWINGLVLVPPSFPAHPNDLSFLNSAPVVARAARAALAERDAAMSPAPTPVAPDGQSGPDPDAAEEPGDGTGGSDDASAPGAADEGRESSSPERPALPATGGGVAGLAIIATMAFAGAGGLALRRRAISPT